MDLGKLAKEGLIVLGTFTLMSGIFNAFGQVVEAIVEAKIEKMKHTM